MAVVCCTKSVGAADWTVAYVDTDCGVGYAEVHLRRSRRRHRPNAAIAQSGGN